MRNKTTGINKTTVLNISSTFILQGLSFLTIPIFTRLLGAEQYGIFSVYNSWVVVLSCIMGLNVGSSLGTAKHHFKDQYEEFRSSTLLLGTIASALIIAICMALIVPLSKIMGYGYIIYILMVITAFANFIINFAQLTFIYEKKPWSNFIFSITLSVSTIAISILLVLLAKNEERYLGRIVGYSIPYVVIGVVLWFVFYFKKPTLLKKEFVKYALILGVPIVFHSLSQNILSQSDRVMMQLMKVSDADIGIYSLYHSFVGVLATILVAFNNSWAPFFYDDLDNGDWIGLNKKAKNYIELFTVLVIGFLLLSREVSYLLADEEFWPGIDLIPLVAIAIYFTFLYQFPVNFEFYNKKTSIIAIGTCAAAIANIALNIWLIPLLGMYGAAITTAISYFLLFLIHFFVVKLNKNWEYKIQFTSFIPSILLVASTCGLFYLLKEFIICRWVLGALLGVFELYRIYKRKTLF